MREVAVIRSVPAPRHLRKSRKTRQVHVLDMVEAGDVLRPGIGLNTFYMRSCLPVQAVERIKGVTPLQRDIASDSQRFSVSRGLCGLIVVKIEIALGHHHHVIALAGSPDTPFRSSPGHNGSSGCHASLQYLVPADELLPTGVQKFLYPVKEIALQLPLVRKPMQNTSSLIPHVVLTS